MAYKSQSNAELYREMGKVRTYRNVDEAFIHENTTASDRLIRVYLSREDALALLRENSNADIKCNMITLHDGNITCKFYIEITVSDLSWLINKK